MPKFVLFYIGGLSFENREAGAAHQQKWMAWMEEVRAAMVEPGLPVGKGKTVTATGISDDVSAARVSGFSVVEAKDLDAALAIAKSCPHLDIGSINVAPAMSMEM
jgi:hypothetical protein